MRSDLVAVVLCVLAGCGEPALPALNPGLPCEPEGVATDVSFEPDHMLCVQLEVDPDDFAALGAQQRFGSEVSDQFDGVIDHVLRSCTAPFPDPYTWFEADVVLDGAPVVQVGVRKKGFIGSALAASRERPSLKLDLDRFVDGQQLGETERITLNNNVSDPSRMHTCLFFSVFDDAGYPAPRCNLANVVVNGTSRGAYSHVEDQKKAFLRRAFGDDTGDYYEATVADFQLAQLAEGLGRWEAKTSETDASGAPLVRVAEALQARDDELERALGEVLDLDRFVTFWALEVLLGHQDGYANNTNNTLIYFDPALGDRGVMVPWGPDDAMRNEGAQGFVQGEIARRLSRHPTLSGRLAAELERLLDEVWDEERLLERIDRFAAQVRTAEDDADFVDHEAELVNWVRGRRAVIEAAIAQGTTVGPDDTNACGPIDPEDFNGIGVLLTAGTYGCETSPVQSRSSWWLALRRRR